MGMGTFQRRERRWWPFLNIVGLLLVAPVSVVLAGEPLAFFSGTVTDTNDVPLYGANVLLKENYAGAATDYNGQFSIRTAPGQYTLEITYVGYQKIKEQIKLTAGTPLTRHYRLKIASFQIGGIVVLAERELLPSSAESRTRISAGEIEHIQASSLSDVLKLMPGQKFDNPGLQSLKQVAVRTSSTDTDADRNAAFGTQIILDGIPISNNANMQIDTKVNAGGIQRTTENSGIDLRQIPADNIAEVEVIRGIPSAKYGDLTSGIVKVQTRAETVQQRFKYKYNLQNQELNFNGGFRLYAQSFNYNLNYARSVRDVRIADYGYSRVAAQLGHSARLYRNLYVLDNKVYYTRAFDEQGLREADVLLSERYNRDYTLRYNHTSKFILTPAQKLEFNYALNFTRQNSYSKRLITSDNTYLSDRMLPGTQEGIYFKTDTSRLWVKGRAYNHFANLEYNATFNLLRTAHNLLIGGNYRLERNDGPGRIFDPLRPPTLTSIFRDRPRSYSAVPDLKLTSLYLEDKISGRAVMEYQVNLGLRAEMYGSGERLFPDNHGVFWNPRLNLILKPGENTQIRAGYGVTSKAPSLSMLFPNPIYFDLDDINRYYGNDSLNLVVISTYIFERSNPQLKGYQQFKREMSFDQQIGAIGVSVTAYNSQVRGGYANTLIRPIFLYKYDFPNWPDTSGRRTRDSVATSYSVTENSQDLATRGLEFSIQTRPLTALKMKFRLEAAYNQTRSHSHGYEHSDSYLYDNLNHRDVKPFWNVIDVQSENLLINYRLEFTLKELGAWITCEAQQVVFDKNRELGLADSLAVGYLTYGGNFIYFTPAERTPDLPSAYKRIYPDYWSKAENQQNVWLFNLRVSKALYQGSEVSFFVNNIFNSHPLYRRQRTSPETKSYSRLNPELFFGVEFSGVLDKMLGK